MAKRDITNTKVVMALLREGVGRLSGQAKVKSNHVLMHLACVAMRCDTVGSPHHVQLTWKHVTQMGIAQGGHTCSWPKSKLYLPCLIDRTVE